MSARLRLEIAGIPVADLIRDFGTPTYVYDGAVIAERIAQLSPFDVVRYAQKANSNLAVLDWCRRHGALVDAVSAGEIHRALAAGYEPTGDPPPIVYTADIFDADALELVVRHGIPVNCGSPDMIDQYGERMPGGELTLRVNPGFGHGHSQKTNTGGEQSKHGVWHETLGEALERAARHRLAVSGVHLHIGSGADLEHLALVVGAAEQLALEIGSSVHTISAGGGLPVPYRDGDPSMDVDAYFRLWDGTRKRLEERFGHEIRIEIEPGRFLVAEAGFLIAEIRAIKKMGPNTFYLVDAGFNTLARPVMYGAYHPMSIVPGDEGPRSEHDVVVGGPLCESGDIFTQEEGGYVRHERLPEARVGEHLVIEKAGAYGFVMSSNYNSKPQPAEVLVTEGKPHLARARQSAEDLIRGERLLPDGSS
ncbi:MAG: diaminopimelate decarboxylase [Deltaproteobacteria bacterium]|nr:diaminopimelate decarboxylase [Deltaproteobacteria bacterium]